jgi:tetratricopeptide (TPR) repeat protein
MVPIPPPVPMGSVPLRAMPGMHTAVQQALKGSYPAGHYQRGLFLKQKGDLDGALIEFLKAVQENPQNVKSFYEQAVIFRARGYTKLAQSALQQALAVKPDYHEARILLASVHLDDGQLSQAAQTLLSSLGIRPMKAPWPSLIQTPHGKLKMPELKLPPQLITNNPRPPAVPPPVKPKTDAFGEKPDTGGTDDIKSLLKGIPGFAGESAPVAAAATPEAKPAESAFEHNIEEAGTAIAQQLEAIKQQFTGKRKKKARMWLDSFLDRANEVKTPEELPKKLEKVETATRRGAQVNPLKMIESARFRKAPDEVADEDNDAVKPETAPASRERPVVAAADVPTPKVIPPRQDALAQNADDEDREAETLTNDFLPLPDQGDPAPFDISHLIRKAMAWLPLPMFKPLENPDAARRPAPQPPASMENPPPPAPPVMRAPESATTVQLTPQANLIPPAMPPAVPDLTPVPLLGQAQPVAPGSEGNGLDGVLRLLPKELAVSVVQVLNPQPVEIPSQPAAVPTLQTIAARPPGAAAPVPSAIPHQAQPFENLVAAQVSAPPTVPVPQMPAASGTPPLPQPMAAQQTSAIPQPVARAIAQVLPPQIAQAIVPSMPVQPQQAPMPVAPVARSSGAALPQPGPSRLPSPMQSNGLAPAPLPATVSHAPAPNTVRVAAHPTTHAMPAPAPWAPQPVQGQAPSVVPVGIAVPGPGGPVPAPISASAPARVVPNAVPNVATPPQVAMAQPTSFPTAPQYDPTAAIPLPPPQVVNSPVAKRLSSQGFKFVAPAIVSSQAYVLSTAKTAPKPAPKPAPVVVAKPAAPKPVPAQPAAPPEDDFAKRMKFLLANGTASLRPGEAFMFSEETGEGVLFLPTGSVRRKIAQPQDHEEVARVRRPDILVPQGEMQYQLSLLGKIIKPQAQSMPQPQQQTQLTPTDITAKELLGRQDEGIFGWFRNVFKF